MTSKFIKICRWVFNVSQKSIAWLTMFLEVGRCVVNVSNSQRLGYPCFSKSVVGLSTFLEISWWVVNVSKSRLLGYQ